MPTKCYPAKIGVVRLWPNQATAERENLMRLHAAAKHIGARIVEIDRNGYYVDGSGVELRPGDVDFVIHMHFESPKCYDAYSYVTLWNPLRFYMDWGYQPFAANLASHEDFLSCGSTWADDHIRRLTWARRDILEPFPVLNHTLANPIHEARLNNQPRLFYVGINWERLNGHRGRHEDVLRILDDKGVIHIYGPKRIRNIDIWRGFRGYRGEIPFDGASIVDRIADCGISLVLSSEAHVQSELMSNRLFESLAAGAVIICDDNAFAHTHFADTLLYVKRGATAKETAGQILDHYQWICEHPSDARILAKKAQEIFVSKFRLDEQLAAIIRDHEHRVKWHRERIAARTDLNVVYVIVPCIGLDEADIHRCMENVAVQSYRNMRVVVLMDADDETDGQEDSLSTDWKQEFGGDFDADVKQLRMKDARGAVLPLGSVIGEGLAGCAPDTLVLVMGPGERWFSEHVSTLVRMFEDDEALDVAVSNYLLQHRDGKGEEFRDHFAARSALSKCPYPVTGAQMFRARIWAKLPGSFARYLSGGRLYDALRVTAGSSGCGFTEVVTYMLDISETEADATRVAVEEDIQRIVAREYATSQGAALDDGESDVLSSPQASYQLLMKLYGSMNPGQRQSIAIVFLKTLIPRAVWSVFRLMYRVRQRLSPRAN